MTRNEVGFDSNVILYLVSSDDPRAAAAEELLKAGGIVSVQVLNEVVSVARRKFGMDWPAVRDILRAVRATCEITGITGSTHDLGVAIAARYGYRIYDSVILAAALEAGCRVLYSEDMQHGQTIDRITIRNPFVAA